MHTILTKETATSIIGWLAAALPLPPLSFSFFPLQLSCPPLLSLSLPPPRQSRFPPLLLSLSSSLPLFLLLLPIFLSPSLHPSLLDSSHSPPWFPPRCSPSSLAPLPLRPSQPGGSQLAVSRLDQATCSPGSSTLWLAGTTPPPRPPPSAYSAEDVSPIRCCLGSGRFAWSPSSTAADAHWVAGAGCTLLP